MMNFSTGVFRVVLYRMSTKRFFVYNISGMLQSSVNITVAQLYSPKREIVALLERIWINRMENEPIYCSIESVIINGYGNEEGHLLQEGRVSSQHYEKKLPPKKPPRRYSGEYARIPPKKPPRPSLQKPVRKCRLIEMCCNDK